MPPYRYCPECKKLYDKPELGLDWQYCPDCGLYMWGIRIEGARDIVVESDAYPRPVDLNTLRPILKLIEGGKED